MGRGGTFIQYIRKYLFSFAALGVVASLSIESCANSRTKVDTSKPMVATAIPGSDDSSDSRDGRPTPTPVPEKTGFESAKFPFELNNANWKLIADEEGVQTYQKKTQSTDIVSFRGETLIPASLIKIATILNTDSLRKEWIDALIEAHTIEEVSKVDRIEYNHSKVPWPFEDRDFVYRANVYVKKNPLTMLLTLKSVEDAREPPKKGIVRGEIVSAFYYMKEVEGVRATKVVVEMALDPKGAIPLWMMNMVQKNWPSKTLERLRKLAQREDIVPSDEIREYFMNHGEVMATAGSSGTPAQKSRKTVAKTPKPVKLGK